MALFPKRRAFIAIGFVFVLIAVFVRMGLSVHSQPVSHIPDPFLLSDVYDGSNPSHPTELHHADGTVFMFAYDENGRGVWINNGPEDGVQFVAEVNSNADLIIPPPVPTPYSTPAANFGAPTTVNDQFFYGNDDGNGVALWVSDGSPAGTMQVQAIAPNGDGSFPSSLVAFNDQLIYRVRSSNDSELWVTDGTESNTHPVIESMAGSEFSHPHNLINHQNAIYFRANDETLGDSIWRTDGTEAGTWMVVDIVPSDDGSSFYNDYLVSAGELFYFFANHPTFGNELWRSDGTSDGTWVLKDIADGANGSLPYLWDSITFGGIFYFYADDINEHGGELWRTDGTVENTVLVKDINEGVGDSFVRRLAVVNGRLIFTAIDDMYGHELWVSDGTEDGTIMLVDINPNGDAVELSSKQDYAVMNGLYYFVADDNVHGRELWQSDGTAAGTVMVKDINPGSESSNPNHFEVIDNTLYFSADDGEHGIEPWVLSHNTFARDDDVVVTVSHPLTIPILENDNYFDPDQIMFVEITEPQHGVAALNGSTIIYTPDATYLGSDSFSYAISDGSSEPSFATVYITVEGMNNYLPFILYDGPN